MLLTTLATTPITIDSRIVTKPAAGVMATRPTTAPMHAPKAEGLFPFIQSKNIQESMAAAEAVLVVAKARAARPEAPIAEPALKPNQPNQSIPVPRITNGTFAGSCVSIGHMAVPAPSIIAPANAANPADMCTTVPPAKSFTPHLKKIPSGCHVQWARGA